ncbi:hypothetical protein QTP86_028654, partial [Hemibagrus guttatus]
TGILLESMAAQGTQVYDTLTRRHGVRVVTSASVEECSLAAGEVVGHANVVAASQMNSTVVLVLNTVRAAATDALHWLLKESLILGARLDIAGNALTQTLLTSGVITLGHLVDLAGPELNDADGAAACVRPRSTRTVAQLLQKWNSALSPEEKGMLMEYCGGIEWPDEEDPFPELTMSPDLEGSTGHFLESHSLQCPEEFFHLLFLFFQCSEEKGKSLRGFIYTDGVHSGADGVSLIPINTAERTGSRIPPGPSDFEFNDFDTNHQSQYPERNGTVYSTFLLLDDDDDDNDDDDDDDNDKDTDDGDDDDNYDDDDGDDDDDDEDDVDNNDNDDDEDDGDDDDNDDDGVMMMMMMMMMVVVLVSIAHLSAHVKLITLLNVLSMFWPLHRSQAFSMFTTHSNGDVKSSTESCNMLDSNLH